MKIYSKYSYKQFNIQIAVFIFIQLLTMNSIHAEMLQKPESMNRSDCLTDLNYSADFLLHNDAEIVSKNWKTYPSNVQQYINLQNATQGGINTVEDCSQIINKFFKKIRVGHLWLSDTNGGAMVDIPKEKQKEIIVEKLSPNTTYINLPSFMSYAQSEIEDVIKSNEASIRTADYLIIDLRNNEGGSDTTFQPLFALMGVQEYKAETPSVYASEKNIRSWGNIVQYLDNPENKKMVLDLIEKMKDQKNHWVRLFDQPYTVENITQKDVVSTTKKIAILIDQACGSSCEQFILFAEQNPRVITIGRHTFGAIDASNVRSEVTPSGKFLINYATTFVIRKDRARIDGIGIAPNILLKRPENIEEENNEITIAKNILEDN